MLGNYELGIEWLLRSLATFNEWVVTYWGLSVAYAQLGRMDEAREAVRKMRELTPQGDGGGARCGTLPRPCAEGPCSSRDGGRPASPKTSRNLARTYFSELFGWGIRTGTAVRNHTWCHSVDHDARHKVEAANGYSGAIPSLGRVPPADP